MPNFHKTEIDGVLVIELSVFSDTRGVFFESWRDIDYKTVGIPPFLQDNLSVSYKNVLRGLHYAQDQGQLVSIVQGHVFDVVVDIRPESPTYKKYFSIELNAENPQQLYMPPGCAHGFCVLSDVAIMHYKCTQYYGSSKEGRIRWDDPDIGIKWPKCNYIISDLDAHSAGIG